LTEITERKNTQFKLQESEKRFREIFQNAGDAIGVVDANDNILDVNPKMCEMMGYSREELLSMKVIDLQAPENRGEDGKIVTSEFERFENTIFEVQNIRNDGKRISIELRISRFEREGGDLFFCIYRDISLRKQAEGDRRGVFDTLTTVLESIDAHIYVSDMHSFKILYMNKNMQDAFGADLTGHLCYQAFRNEQTSCSHCSNDRLMDSRGNPSGVHVWETENPITKRWYENHDRAIYWHDERLVKIQIATDITERKKIEQTLMESEARYRSLFLDSPIELWEQDHSKLKKYIDALRQSGVTDFRDHFRQFPDEVIKCYKLIEILNVNQTALDQNAAENLDSLRERMPDLLITESLDSFRDQLIGFAEGENLYEGEIVSKNLAGELIFSMVRVLIPPGFEDSWSRVFLISLDITSQKKAERILRGRADELAALHAITVDLKSSAELQPMLKSIVAKATELLSGSSGGLYLCDAQKQEVRCVVSYNTEIDYAGTILNYGEGAAGRVAETGEPLEIEDYRLWAGRADVYKKEQDFQAILSAPISWQAQVEGVIHVLRDSKGEKFTSTDLDLLMTLANNAAIAIQNTRLFQQIQKHANEMEAAVGERTAELQILVDSMVGREVRMAELKKVIKLLRYQLIDAGIDPIADDPLNEPLF